MESMLDNNLDEDDEIKKKTCEKIREKHEKFKASLKRIKEEFKKKNDNKDMLKSMMDDFMLELEDFRKMIQLQGNFLFLPKEIISIIDDFKEPQEFLIQEKNKLSVKFEEYQKKKNNFETFASEIKIAMNT